MSTLENKLSNETIAQLEEIAEELTLLRSNLRLGSFSLTPLNYDEEKEMFFASSSYNPIFTYHHMEISHLPTLIKSALRKIEKMKIPDDLKEHLLSYANLLNVLYDLKSSVGSDNFQDKIHNLITWKDEPTSDALDEKDIVEHTEKKLFDAIDIKKEFEKKLKNDYHIDNFSIVIDNFTHNIISAGFDRVTIGSNIKRHESNVKRLIVHELESHILQTHNLRIASPLADLSLFSESLLYAEGLAVHNEIATKTINKQTYNTYKLRLEATKMLDKSFREIYDYLSQFINPERAYVMTYRVKRGMRDTKKPGGNPKDSVYLVGYHKVIQFLKNGGTKETLYRTKTPQLTQLLDKYNLIPEKPAHLPKFITKL